MDTINNAAAQREDMEVRHGRMWYHVHVEGCALLGRKCASFSKSKRQERVLLHIAGVSWGEI